MKTKTKLFFWFLTLCTLFIACDKNNDTNPTNEIEDAISEESFNDAIEMGTVSLRPFVKEVIQVKTEKAPTLEEVLDALNITIYKSDGTGLVLSDKYRDLPEFINLPQGLYEYYMDAIGPANQLYGADGTFSISAGTNTEISPIVTLKELASTINFSAEIQATYPDIHVESTTDNYENNEPSMLQEWDVSENGVTKYFAMDYSEGPLNKWLAQSADLTITIIALNPLNEEIRVSKTYLGVVANQHYNITVAKTAPGSTGNGSFDITLGDEEVIDDTIIFPN